MIRDAASRDCPFAGDLDRVAWRAAAKDRLLHALIPPARAYVRYAPAPRSAARMWTRWVEPYLAWHSHDFVARTVFGLKMAGHTLDILPQHIYYFGIWEPNLTRFLAGRLRPGDGFVDVGANVGWFSLLAAKLVGAAGPVVSIEASPTICAQLEANVRRNRLHNVRTVNAAASDAPGSLPIFRGPPTHTGLTSVNRQDWLEEEAVVPAAPVADLVTADEWRHVRAIKIDVEGAEQAVVAGLEPLLARGRDDLEVVVELHPGDRSEIFERFAAAGFHAYELDISYDPTHWRNGRSTPRARRVHGPVEGEVDVIFSRRATEVL